jgi:hypothetical protein
MVNIAFEARKERPVDYSMTVQEGRGNSESKSGFFVSNFSFLAFKRSNDAISSYLNFPL